jgi:RNA polymerase sigma factor (sigma-70 family)
MADQRLGTLIRHLRRTVAPPGPVGPRDAQLLERFLRDRDEAAFELLLWRHGPMVLGTCRRLLRHAADVDDAFQATFLVLLRKGRSVSRGEALGAWLYRVAYRVALRARSAARRRAEHERPGLDAAEVPAPPAPPWDDLRPVLDEEVSRLPARERAAFVLCYLQGKTHAEAGRELGCPAGTVSWRLARARERLRRRLARRGVALSAAALAGLVSANATAAPVPAALVSTALRAALLGGGAVSAQAVALTEGVLQAMLLTKVKGVAAVVLALAVVGGGGGAISYRAAAGPAPGGATARLAARSADQDARQIEALKAENAALREQLERMKVELTQHRAELEQARARARLALNEAVSQAKKLDFARARAEEAARKEAPGSKAPPVTKDVRLAENQQRELAERYRAEAQKMQQDLKARQAALEIDAAKARSDLQQARAEAQGLRDQLMRVQRLAENRQRLADDRAVKADGDRAAAAQKARDEVELLKAQLEIKKAELLAAEAVAEGAAKQQERMKALRASGAAAESAILKAHTEATTTMAQVRVKQAELRAAEVALMQAMRRVQAGAGAAANPSNREQRLKELDAKLDALRKEVQSLRQGQGPRRP